MQLTAPLFMDKLQAALLTMLAIEFSLRVGRAIGVGNKVILAWRAGRVRTDVALIDLSVRLFSWPFIAACIGGVVVSGVLLIAIVVVFCMVVAFVGGFISALQDPKNK